MKESASISAVGWENRLISLLREELVSSPIRWRATVRLCVLCVVGAGLVTAYHVPGGQFILLMFFLVAMSDAPTSRATVLPNMLGSLAGGGVGLFLVAAFADQPWILFPLEAMVIAGAMFLMRMSTAPLAMLFFCVSLVIVAPEFLPNQINSLYDGLRAMAFQTAGIGLGTLVQVLWWPENPSVLLLADLSESLRSVGQHCRAVASGRPVAATTPPVRSLRTSAARLFRQLDLLREAETEDRWLRQRHTEQIKLITDIQLLVFAARQWTIGASAIGVDRAARLEAVSRACDELQRAIGERRPPSPPSVPSPRTAPSPSPAPALDELERILSELPALLGFLSTIHQRGPVPPSRPPVAVRRFYTPASPEVTGEAVRYGLKVAFAASFCGLLYRALDWPGISTCVLTTVLVAQATVGLGRHKAVLRFGGALLAGLAVLVTVDVLMPNMHSMASLLVVLGGLTWVAAWIACGSSRTAYLGVQMGVTLYLVLFPTFGPSINLIPARDRLMGILLGIVVMAVVDAALWPVFTGSALRRKISDLLRQMAGLHRCGNRGDMDGVSQHSVGVHRGIAEALTLQEELIFETTAGDAEAETERQVVMRALNRIQEVFLALLAAHRRGGAPAGSLVEGGDAEASRLDEMADALGGGAGSARARHQDEMGDGSVQGRSDIRRLDASITALERDLRPLVSG